MILHSLFLDVLDGFFAWAANFTQNSSVAVCQDVAPISWGCIDLMTRKCTEVLIETLRRKLYHCRMDEKETETKMNLETIDGHPSVLGIVGPPSVDG